MHDYVAVESTGRYRLAVVATHPIQYQTPLWRALASSDTVSLKVFYASSAGAAEYYDSEFHARLAWDIPLLYGYPYQINRSLRLPFFESSATNRLPLGLFDELSKTTYDAVLVSGYATPAAWSAIVAARRTGTPIIMRGETHRRLPRRRLFGAAKRVFLPRLLRSVAGFLAIGQWNRDYWLSLGVPEKQIEMAYYAVDNDYFAERVTATEAASRNLRRALGVSDATTVFVFCGKLIPRKGLEDLIAGVVSLRERHVDCALLVIGAGPLRPPLEQLAARAKGSIRFVGFVNQADLPMHYAAADVCVVPSLQEAWGLVANEAMACGLPCILSDAVGAGPDLVVGRDTGLLFRAGDREDLERVLELATNRDLRMHWRGNIARVLEQHSYAQNIGALSRLLERVTR